MDALAISVRFFRSPASRGASADLNMELRPVQELQEHTWGKFCGESTKQSQYMISNSEGS
eukprot:1801239-Amphidinium_carterae.1